MFFQINQEQEELARTNFSIIKKEAQAILDLVGNLFFAMSLFQCDLDSSLHLNHYSDVRTFWFWLFCDLKCKQCGTILYQCFHHYFNQIIKDVKQGSESVKTIALYVLEAFVTMDHENFLLGQLQSRGFLRSCLSNISNFTYQVPIFKIRVRLSVDIEYLVCRPLSFTHLRPCYTTYMIYHAQLVIRLLKLFLQIAYVESIYVRILGVLLTYCRELPQSRRNLHCY